jgi:hypothetical protein
MIRNIIVVSDTHFGCQLGLCPLKVPLDSGGYYHSSELQKKTYQMWRNFVNEWIPMVTKGEDYCFIVNGDVVDGKHHGSTTQISQNLKDQKNIAIDVLGEVLKQPHCKKYYHIRGTEAHVGASAELEEDIAQQLNASKDEIGNYARWELWLRMGAKDSLVHITHHVGTTSSASYESTAVYKELIEAYTEAGKQRNDPPDVIVRSHRHRYFKTEVSTSEGAGIAIVTPGWQLKTPFTYRITLGRSSVPQIGGIIIRKGDEDSIYTRSKVWNLDRPKEEVI